MRASTPRTRWSISPRPDVAAPRAGSAMHRARDGRWLPALAVGAGHLLGDGPRSRSSSALQIVGVADRVERAR